ASQCSAAGGTFAGNGTNCGGGYTMTPASGSIVPGDTDTGNHFDDGLTTIPLPFTFNFYGADYTQATISSNGDLQFTGTGSFPAAYTNDCLPSLGQITGPTMFPYWDDLYTADGASGEGVFTSVSGSAPNR